MTIHRSLLPRPIGLAALTVLDLAPPDMVSCAADAGYSHVGLRLVPATPTEVQHDTIGDTPTIRETLAHIAGTGVQVLDVEILRLQPETVVGTFAPMLETAARLGASQVLVAGNDADEGRLTDRFAALCELGAPLGLNMNLEPMPWTDVKTVVQAHRIVERAGRDNAGIIVDPLHYDRGGSTLDDLKRVPRRWWRYMQLCDAPAERPTDLQGLLHQARAERLLPGEGGLPLSDLVQAMPADLPISVEIPMQRLARTVPALERARRALRATLDLLAAIAPRNS